MTRTYQTPPECIRVGVEVVILTLFCQVHQKRSQDEAEEANVPGSHQLLQRQEATSLSHSAWKPSMAALPSTVQLKELGRWNPLLMPARYN